ncbi:MAG: sigma-70 family RNA polymerase sigma factor [Bacteroidales bacterium]|nr:sigma-70 family RNA polymerase sigma factor [Bacteroidales bacterium]
MPSKKHFTGSLLDANEQLYYYALQLTEDQEDARDLVQETNFKALKNFGRLKHARYKNAWLYTILRNTHINNLRSGHYRNIVLNRTDNDIQVSNAVLPSNENPDRIFDRKELKDMIRSLPASCAKPLKLFLAGYAYKEIARMTGVPIGTVKSRIHIAKEKLKRAYLNC